MFKPRELVCWPPALPPTFRLPLEGQAISGVKLTSIVHVPLGLVRHGLWALEQLAGPSVFATWEEAELMEEDMVSARGTADARELGVQPKSMREVLGLDPGVAA